MQYPDVIPAIFQRRPNRFIAEVLLDGKLEVVHVKNTGRCKELLIPGVRVWLAPGQNPNRKTAYDLVTVEKGNRLINLDSQAPNKVFQEWAQEGHFRPDLTLLRPETFFGKSRFDFYWKTKDRQGFVEVKGVTLEEGGIAYFPDAPTQRGLRHLDELILCRQSGLEATMCFVIQMESIQHFSPNNHTHPQFGATLQRAQAQDVELLALCCAVSPDGLLITTPIPICL